ncbi:MAG: tubulin-like doman-containing protein, partial [Dolichospermum sp.]
IESAEKRTKGHESLLLQSGLIIEPGLNIFVVGSLCGGTGSGMFLDVGYTLKNLYGEDGAQILGYLVISPELYGNTTSMIANTYAALQELNYYSSPGTKFE